MARTKKTARKVVRPPKLDKLGRVRVHNQSHQGQKNNEWEEERMQKAIRQVGTSERNFLYNVSLAMKIMLGTCLYKSPVVFFQCVLQMQPGFVGVRYSQDDIAEFWNVPRSTMGKRVRGEVSGFKHMSGGKKVPRVLSPGKKYFSIQLS
jgi:hypothetical protein